MLISYYSFSANDYYLKGLIEEWCEGVLCSRNRDDSSAHISKKRTEQHKPYHLFFEKVATHLQNDKERDRVIDVRGLSKVVLLLMLRFRFLLEFCTGSIIHAIRELTLFAIMFL